MLRIINTHKPGIYIRRQVIYRGSWANLYGLSLWPTRRRLRKWTGLAAVMPASAPQPIPTGYKRHDINHSSPYEVNYNPAAGANQSEVIK